MSFDSRVASRYKMSPCQLLLDGKSDKYLTYAAELKCKPLLQSGKLVKLVRTIDIHHLPLTQSAGAVEYTDSISAKV